MNLVKTYFKISERNSTFTKEIVAGLIIFISMFYIIPVQGGMLGNANGISSGTIGIVTAITAGLASISMGIFANYPVALASGMGVNAFIAFTLISGGMPFEAAMSAVLISGLIFVVVSVTPVRKMILDAIPDDIKKAISIGVGLFLMFVALINTGIIIPGGGTPVALGKFDNPALILGLFAIGLSITLWILDVRGGILISMIVVVIVGLILKSSGLSSMHDNTEVLPNLNFDLSTYSSDFKNVGSIFGKSITTLANTKETWENPTWYLAILTIFLNTFFDASGTLFGLNESIEKEHQADKKTNRKVLVVDAISTATGSLFGATSVTIFAESTAGVQYGGRTGITSITVGLLFLLSIPIIPLLGTLFTAPVTAGAIVMIGILMSSKLKDINVDDKVYLVSSIFTIMFMILGYSIGTGIVIGLLTFVILMLCTGRYKEVNWMLYVLSPVLVMFLIIPIWV